MLWSVLDCHKNQHKCVIDCLLHFTPACAELSLASSVPFSFLHCFRLLHCTGENETVTAEEVAENHHFINAICATRVMQHVHKYLVSQGNPHLVSDSSKSNCMTFGSSCIGGREGAGLWTPRGLSMSLWERLGEVRTQHC